MEGRASLPMSPVGEPTGDVLVAKGLWSRQTARCRPAVSPPPPAGRRSSPPRRVSRSARNRAAMAWAPQEIIFPEATPTILRKRRRAPSSRSGVGKHWKTFLHDRADRMRDELAEQETKLPEKHEFELYHVERIIASRHTGTQLLVKWRGYPEDESTWELRSSFSQPDELRIIAEFEAPPSSAATADLAGKQQSQENTNRSQHGSSGDRSLVATRTAGAAVFGASPRAIEMASLLMQPQQHRAEPLAELGQEPCFDGASPNTSLAADLLSRSLQQESDASHGEVQQDGVQGDSLENRSVSFSQSSTSTEEMEAEAVHARSTVEGTLDLAMPCPLCQRDIRHAAADLDGTLACFPCMRAHVMYQGE
jgi:hypothetical protein